MPEVKARRIGNAKWIRVGRGGTGEPCPICVRHDYCSVSEDGASVFCMRVANDHPKVTTLGTGYIHKIGEPMTVAIPTEKPRKRPSDSELHARFAPLCRSWYVGQETAIKQLALSLGVTAWALDALRVGWDGGCWTFPELNHRDQIVGVTRRFPDGGKVCLTGSRRGLTCVEDWTDAPGPIFIVEGGSDVAAGLTMGLCVVGRPSNTGGVDYLVKLLGKHDRRVVVLAERDKKDRATLPESHDPNCHCCLRCFPGKAGAIETSSRLIDRLGRLIDWSFLPDGKKDLRAWLNGSGANPHNVDAMARMAGRLIARTRNAIRH